MARRRNAWGVRLVLADVAVALLVVSCDAAAAPLVATHTPTLRWTCASPIPVPARCFRVTLTSGSDAIATGSDTDDGASADTTRSSRVWWDSGVVWRTLSGDEKPHGVQVYEGPSLAPSTTYVWNVTVGGNSTAPSPPMERCAGGTFTTAAQLPSPEQEARQWVLSAANNETYNATLASLVGRVQSDGYMPTSLTGEYSGMFVRDTSAAVLAFLEAGRVDVARAVLSRVLEVCADPRFNLSHAPHVISKTPSGVYSVQTGPKFDQPDGNWHLVLAWARYVAVSGDRSVDETYYPLMRKFTDHYVGAGSRYLNASLQLMWNPNLEHSRLPYYMSVYDVLTNSFASSALGTMAAAAARHGDSPAAARYTSTKAWLQAGVFKSLVYDADSSGSVFAELRFAYEPDFLLWGVSWVSMGPVPAYVAGDQAADLDTAHMDATMDAYRRYARFLWFNPYDSAVDPGAGARSRAGEDGAGDVGAGVVSTSGDGPLQLDVSLTCVNASWHTQPQQAIIGKGFAWEVGYAAMRGQWARVALLMRWLDEYSPQSSPSGNHLFGESYWYPAYLQNATGFASDPGNAEQSGWFVFFLSRVRQQLGHQLV